MVGQGTVTIKILGDAKEAVAAFGEVGTKVEETNGKLASIGTAFAGFAAVGIGAALGVGAALFDIGDKFDTAYNNIASKTGATGTQLDNLKEEFKGVVSDVPTDFGKASDAVATVEQKLGLTGDAARGISDQFLELSRITKTDLTANLQSGTDALNAWSTTTAQQPAILDEMYRATTLTGISFTDLSSQLATNQPVLAALGFSMQDSIALLSGLKAGGVDVSEVMPALSKSLASAAKEGIPANQVLSETFNAIKNAPNDTAAAADAMTTFGAKAGPKLAELIREGKLSFSDLQATLEGGTGTIMDAGQHAMDFGDKWELIKNRVFVALEPVAMKLFDGIGQAMDKIGPIIERIAAAFSEGGFAGALKQVAAEFDVLSPKIKLVMAGAAALGIVILAIVAPVPMIVLGIGAIVAALIYAYTHFESFRDVVDGVISGVTEVITTFVTIVEALWSTFGDTIMAYVNKVWPPLRDLITAVMQGIQANIKFILDLIHGDWGAAWDDIKAMFAAVWDAITAFLSVALDTLQAAIGLWLDAEKALLSAAWDAVTSLASSAWDNIKSLVSGAIDSVVGFVTSLPGRISDGVVGAFDAIPDAFKAAIDTIIMAWNSFGIPSFHIHIDMPSVIPNIDFDTPSIDFPNLPLLAHGAVISRPTLALIGEDARTTPEIVSPERLLRQIVHEESGGVGGGAGVHVHPGAVVVSIGSGADESMVRRVVNTAFGQLITELRAG